MVSRHAYLIMAHKNPEQVNILLSLLNDGRNDIFLHIDKKAMDTFSPWLEEFKASLSHSRLTIVASIACHWGGYSQIQCELNLLKAALEDNGGRVYKFIHLLSGQDLPLKTQDEIHAFFAAHEGQEFIDFYSPHFPDALRSRLCYYHLFESRDVRHNLEAQKLYEAHLQKQVAEGVDRLRHSKVIFYKGANWFSISGTFAQYLVDQEAMIRKQFRFTSCADEIFLQTIFMVSPFKDSLYYKGFDDNMISIVRNIDWNRGNPYVWKYSDLDDLFISPHCFARKFDMVKDREVVLAIADRIRKSSSHG